MNYRNERLNQSMCTLEEAAGGTDLAKWRVLSDHEADVERMVFACDFDPDEEARRDARENEVRAARLRWAKGRLRKADKGYLIRVLLLIVKNGSNLEFSLRKVSRRTYFRHRNELLDFFSWHSTAPKNIGGHAI